MTYDDYSIPFNHSIDELGYITFTFKLSAGDMQNQDCFKACLSRLSWLICKSTTDYISAMRKDGKL